MADAVDAAARDLRVVGENVRSGQVLAQDAVLEVIEQAVIAIDNLRIGAGTVHGSVAELETRIRDEVVRIMGEINMTNTRVHTGETAMQHIGNAISAVDSRVTQIESSPGVHGRPERNILEYKRVQNVRSLSGEKTQFRQWHQKLINVLYTGRE